jgi:hypothetical protein
MNFSNKQIKIIDLFVLASAVLVTLVALIWNLAHSHYGIDVTDESYYLIWMSNPWIYPISVTQFGFIYHPLYLLFHGDISLLRQTNILIIFGLAWLLCSVFFRATITTPNLSWRSLPMLALAFVSAMSAFVYFCPYGWVATPSYNSLVFQALLLTSIGLLLAEKTVSLVSIIGWLLIGIGGWLTFMAKPSSAAALALLVSICLPLTNKFNVRLFGISLLTAVVLLIATAWIIDGSLAIFIDRLKNGIEVVRLLDAGQFNMLRFDNLKMGEKEQYLLIFVSIATFLLMYFSNSQKKISVALGLSFVLLLELASLAIISDYFLLPISTPFDSQTSLIILAIPLSTTVLGFTLRPSFKMSEIQWGIALYFAVLPHVLAFGSNNNYWQHGSLGSLFWILAGLVILIPSVSQRGNWRMLLAVIASGQLITIFLLQTAMEHPYFNLPEPFRQYDNVVTIGIDASEIILPKELAQYYRDVKKMADQTGFRADTPMLDMTGHSPGVLYVMGAKAIGQAWMIGGFSGSNQVAIATLNHVSCVEIAEAWLIINPDSQRKLSPILLSNFGIHFEKDFELAAEFSIPATNKPHWGVPQKQLQLWRPKPTTQDTITACEKKRHPL